MALYDPVDVLFGIFLWSSIPVIYSFLYEPDELGDVIKFSFLENTLFGKILINDKFAMSQIVENW